MHACIHSLYECTAYTQICVHMKGPISICDKLRIGLTHSQRSYKSTANTRLNPRRWNVAAQVAGELKEQSHTQLSLILKGCIYMYLQWRNAEEEEAQIFVTKNCVNLVFIPDY